MAGKHSTYFQGKCLSIFLLFLMNHDILLLGEIFQLTMDQVDLEPV